MAGREKRDPYCEFKDDTERRRALRNRSVCTMISIVCIALCTALAPVGAATSGGTDVIAWVKGAVHSLRGMP